MVLFTLVTIIFVSITTVNQQYLIESLTRLLSRSSPQYLVSESSNFLKTCVWTSSFNICSASPRRLSFHWCYLSSTQHESRLPKSSEDSRTALWVGNGSTSYTGKDRSESWRSNWRRRKAIMRVAVGFLQIKSKRRNEFRFGEYRWGERLWIRRKGWWTASRSVDFIAFSSRVLLYIFGFWETPFCSHGMIEVCEEFCLAQGAFVPTTSVWDNLR